MTHTTFIKIVGWSQLLLSALLAASIIWVYSTYQSSFGYLAQSIYSTVLTTSDVIIQISDSIKSREKLADEVGSTLNSLRDTVSALQKLAKSHGEILPQYAKNLNDASSVSSDLSLKIGEMSDALMFKVPTSVYWDHMKPVLVWTAPLGSQAQAFKSHAQQIKGMSDSLKATSGYLSNDAAQVNSAFMASCDHVIRLLDETASSVVRLKDQDIPGAVAKLEAASSNFREISGKVNDAGNFALGLLCLGLIMATLCAFQSVGMILMARQQSQLLAG
ncbi:MAG: hypothetical protein HY016_00035 [Nitrosomonadales bacterium]|nr:hypothetical protein [Nitrosomonadales bacterium]